ncbi:asparaginase [Providencia rettgeri]|nr:asparaginase [Providencia rettgeri]
MPMPEINDVAIVKGEQISNTISGNISSEILLNLSKRVNHLLNEGKQQGVVITHGTDTIEETAFFLELTTQNKQPIVIVGAMRPANRYQCRMNCFASYFLLVDKKAENRGVLNDRIGLLLYHQSKPTTPDAFKSYEPGYLGVFVSGPKFYYSTAC